MEDLEPKKKFGGRTSTSWDAKYHLGKTKSVRIPEVISEDVLKIVKMIDEGKLNAKDIFALVE